MSPVLTGRFFTTAPPGKPLQVEGCPYPQRRGIQSQEASVNKPCSFFHLLPQAHILFQFFTNWAPQTGFFSCHFLTSLRFLCLRRIKAACFGYFLGPISEKAMAPHSSTLAWKIPWTEEPGRLQSTGLLRVRHD